MLDGGLGRAMHYIAKIKEVYGLKVPAVDEYKKTENTCDFTVAS